MKVRHWRQMLGPAIILVAFAVRIAQLGAQSFWYDEGYTVQFAQHSLASIFVGAAQLELNTPLHYFALHGWMRAVGESEFSARLLSVFAGVLTVVFIKQCLQELRVVKAGQWFGAALVAWSPVCISASQEVRMYALLVCLCCCAQWLWLRYIRSHDRRAGWLWCAASLFAFATHVLAALVFAAQVCITLILIVQEFRRLKHWQLGRASFPMLLTCAAVMVGWTAFILAFRSGYGTSFTDLLAFGFTLTHSLAAMLLTQTKPETWVMAAAIGVALILALTALVRGTCAWSSAGISALSLILIAAFCSVTGKFAARYAGIIAPLFFMTLAHGVFPVINSRSRKAGAKLQSGGVPIGLSCISLVAVVASAAEWRFNPIYQQEDYRGAATYLQHHLKPNETVLLVSGHQAPVFNYYFGPSLWHALPPDAVLDVRNTLDYASASQLLNSSVAGRPGAWLLLWQEDVIDPTFIVQGLLRRQANKLQPDVDTQEFRGLRLLHFTFNQPYQPTPEQFPLLIHSRMKSGNLPIGLNGLGCHQFRPVVTGSSLLEVACFWQREPSAKLPYDLKVSLRIVDGNGQRLAQSDQNLGQPYGLPYFEYKRVVTSFYFIPIPEELKPGTYELQVIPYSSNGEVDPQVYTPIVISH